MKNPRFSLLSIAGRTTLCMTMLASTAAALALAPQRGKQPGNATPESSEQAGSAVAAGPVGESFQTLVNSTFRLRASRIVTIDVPNEPDVPITTAVEIDGQPFTLNLQPHSNRAPNYQLRAQIADGSIIQVDPGPERMLRGTLAELPGSQVAGGLLEDGLHFVVLMPDGQRVWTEPLRDRVAGAAPNQFVQYRDNEVIPNGGECGVTNDFLAAQPAPAVPNEGNGDEGGIAGSTIFCTELACDADVEYFNAYGSVVNVQNRINLVINTMDLQYINQVDIDHVITNILVRTAEPDPYSSTVAGTLLSQFRNEWINNQGAIPRDVAQLFTRKELDGTTIGIAWGIGQICTTGAYCLVQSDCCGSLACATDLSSHELGHLWGGQHCTASCSSTMNSSITCVNTFLNSNPSSVTQIVNHRNTRTCLSQCADATLPFFDDFPSTTIDSAKWTTIVSVTSNTLGSNEPSAPNSLNLKGNSSGGTQIRTSRINATGLTDFQMSYMYQARGGGDLPETNDNLVVEYFNNLGVWTNINTHIPAGTSQTTFTPATVVFPADALHSDFRVRFRNTSTQNNLDDWFVDNVNITGFGPPANDTCAAASVIAAGSHPFSTQGASTDGPDETTGCGFGSPTQITKDIWYKWLATCTGNATVSLCGSSFDARLASYFGCPAGPGAALGCNDNFCGSSPQITFPVIQNQLIRIRIGGVNNASGVGTMVISCTPSAPPCEPDVNNSGTVDIDDLVQVITNWGSAGGPADINNDNIVNIDDLVQVITNWGACP